VELNVIGGGPAVEIAVGDVEDSFPLDIVGGLSIVVLGIEVGSIEEENIVVGVLTP